MMTAFQILHFIAAIFFGLSAYVQINDPDPEIWIPLYLLPSLISFGTAIFPEFTEHDAVKRVNEMIIVGYCIYGGFILDSSYKFERDIFSWIVHDEAGREFGGLLIISLWTGLMHGSASTTPTKSLVLMSSVILVPAAFWIYVYLNKNFREMWPEHCQTALYPD